jgi:uncharacterized protein with von Willebrand factor type A (vWA) domain
MKKNTFSMHSKMNQQEFIDTVREWLTCDMELTKLQRHAKELRERKKELGALVIDEMEEKNLNTLDTGSTLVRVTKTRRKQPLTRKYLEARLAEMFGAGSDAYKAAEDNILNNRPVKEHKELKAKSTQ